MVKSKAKASKKLSDIMSLDPKNQAASVKALKRIKKNVAEKKEEATSALSRRGIILINHLPFGFFEDEIKGFFSQFGQVLRVRVARSPKTGKPKGYAFVEFQYEGVAKIAAESMNNYLMFERLIKCKLVDSAELKHSTKIFKGKNITKSSFPTLHRRNKIKADQDKPLTEEELEKAKVSRERAVEKHNQKLQALGINYQFQMSTENQNEQLLKRKTRKRKVSQPELKIESESPGTKKRKSVAPENDNAGKKERKSVAPENDNAGKKERKSVAPENDNAGKKERKSVAPENDNAGKKERKSVALENDNAGKKERKSVALENDNAGKKERKSVAPENDNSGKKERKSIAPENDNAGKKERKSIAAENDNAGKKKRKSFEKFSPKVTRSKAAAVITPSPAPVSKLGIRQTKSMGVKDQVPDKKKRKSMEKFSPKLTRSKARASLGPSATTPKPVKKTGRVSDISELNTFQTQTKKLSRKSCI